MPDVSWLFSWKDYWYAFVGAVLGTGCAILWAAREFSNEQRRDHERCVTRLRNCLTFNEGRLKQAINLLDEGKIPNYPLDTSQLNYWLTQSVDILGDELVKAIDWERYQLDHITSKMLIVSNVVLMRGLRAKTLEEHTYDTAVSDDLRRQINGILEHLPGIIQRINSSLHQKGHHPAAST